MKKTITGILAISLTAALLTGCGQTGNSSESFVSAVAEAETTERRTVNETTQESAASTKASETTVAEPTKTSGEGAELSADYEGVLRAFYDATNSDDYEALMKTTYPAKIVEGMLELINLDPDGFNEAMESNGHYEITDII